MKYPNSPTRNLSGNAYVSVVLRSDLDTFAIAPNSVIGRVRIAHSPKVCDHGITICTDLDCIESWSVDYRLMLWRTGGGRRLAEELNLNPDTDPQPELNRRWKLKLHRASVKA